MRNPILIALTLAALIAAPALGGDHGRGKHREPGGPIAKHAERLGLDQATLDEMQRIARASRDEGQALRDELRAARKQLRALLEVESPDEAAVMAQAERMGALETQKRKHRLATMLEIRALLTPAQRAELAEIMGERREAKERRRAERMAAVQTACAQDLTQFCADVPEGRERGRCLYEHRDQLSDACRGVLRPRGGHRHGKGDRF